MSYEGVRALSDRWGNDPAFRAALRANPEATVRGGNFDLNEDEMAVLRSIDWSKSDDELTAEYSPHYSSAIAPANMAAL